MKTMKHMDEADRIGCDRFQRLVGLWLTGHKGQDEDDMEMDTATRDDD